MWYRHSCPIVKPFFVNVFDEAFDSCFPKEIDRNWSRVVFWKCSGTTCIKNLSNGPLLYGCTESKIFANREVVMMMMMTKSWSMPAGYGRRQKTANYARLIHLPWRQTRVFFDWNSFCIFWRAARWQVGLPRYRKKKKKKHDLLSSL